MKTIYQYNYKNYEKMKDDIELGKYVETTLTTPTENRTIETTLNDSKLTIPDVPGRRQCSRIKELDLAQVQSHAFKFMVL